MSIEEKVVVGSIFEMQYYDKIYKPFGWQSMSFYRVHEPDDRWYVRVFSRETQNPVYSKLVEYEKRYKELCTERYSIHVGEFDLIPCLFLFVLGIFPLIIFLVSRSRKKTRIKELDKQMQQVIDESSALLNNNN